MTKQIICKKEINMLIWGPHSAWGLMTGEGREGV